MNSGHDILERLYRLNEIGAALSAQQDINQLLEDILEAAMEITFSQGGTLYRVTDDERYLRFEIVRNKKLGIELGGPGGGAIEDQFPLLPLYKADGTANDHMVASWAVLSGKTVNIPDAYDEGTGFDLSGTRRFDLSMGFRSTSFLTVPMLNHENEVIGVLQLINAENAVTGEVRQFSIEDQQLVESLASQAAVALTNRLLIRQMEELFESFIALINVAIDEKSPYTAGHCERVPELTLMLADAVNRCDQGPLASFEMSARDRYELKIAGLLHDCGKVTTPVHVVDKGTKLQTLFDRIHLVDARFDVIRRDIEIDFLRAVSSGEDKEALLRLRDQRLFDLEADREFVRKANIGGERMSDVDIARVGEIAQKYQWHGTDGTVQPLLSEDEAKNLSIRAGTLTNEERDIINYHIVATIHMLETLPWPKHLKKVPEFAGGHHERMDGKGYPKGLRGDQMSVQARIMAIADIFEALTARDRPYKPGMKLSQALEILGKFSLGGHIDPDLFQIFVRSGVYMKYAERYLDSAQIDDIDLSKIPGLMSG